MQNERKKLEELNLLDDFLFNAMMTYPEMGALPHFHRGSAFIMPS